MGFFVFFFLTKIQLLLGNSYTERNIRKTQPASLSADRSLAPSSFCVK